MRPSANENPSCTSSRRNVSTHRCGGRYSMNAQFGVLNARCAVAVCASSKPHPTLSCYNRASMKRLKRGACMAWRWLRAIQRRIREHADLAVECAALRHQVAILQRSRPRHLRFGPWDRLLWALLSQYWPRWREAGPCSAAANDVRPAKRMGDRWVMEQSARVSAGRRPPSSGRIDVPIHSLIERRPLHVRTNVMIVLSLCRIGCPQPRAPPPCRSAGARMTF
jgi:hypothetical protein